MSTDDNPQPLKKAKRDNSELEDYLEGDLVRLKELAKTNYQNSEPYKHCVLGPLFQDSFLREVRHEVLEQLSFTEKETDIYKLYQTGDFANIDGLPVDELKQLPNVNKLRKIVGSDFFRNMISDIAQCGPLSAKKIDLAASIYKKGCYLLNHDDVIGTRRVSFILYLTDPDDPWKPEYGGALQLFPTLEPGTPSAEPSVQVQVGWNQMAFFEVIPGHSFHEVQEVYVNKSRLSIQGWFHAPLPEEPQYNGNSIQTKKSISTLQGLMNHNSNSNGIERPILNWRSILIPNGALTVSFDMLINPEYLSETVINSLRTEFVQNSFLYLKDFLNIKYLQQLKHLITHLEDQSYKDHNYEVSVPPHKHRFRYLDPQKMDGRLDVAIFKSQGWNDWIEQVTNEKLSSSRILSRQFRPGSDYTLAMESDVTENTLECTYDFTLNPRLHSGSYGGLNIYMEPDDDKNTSYQGEKAEVYERGNSDAVLLSIKPSFNSMLIVLRDPTILNFVKYVNKEAHASRFDTVLQYRLE